VPSLVPQFNLTMENIYFSRFCFTNNTSQIDLKLDQHDLVFLLLLI
jgi:hypothetical protein